MFMQTPSQSYSIHTSWIFCCSYWPHNNGRTICITLPCWLNLTIIVVLHHLGFFSVCRSDAYTGVWYHILDDLEHISHIQMERETLLNPSIYQCQSSPLWPPAKPVKCPQVSSSVTIRIYTLVATSWILYEPVRFWALSILNASRPKGCSNKFYMDDSSSFCMTVRNL